MLRYHELVIGHAHHSGHGFGGVKEHMSDDGSGGDAKPLHLDAVVHTARTAGPSITYPGN